MPLLAPESAAVRPGLGWSDGQVADAGAAAALACAAFDPDFREAWTEAQIAGMLVLPSGWMDIGCETGAAGPSALRAFSLCRQIADEAELLLCAIHPDVRRLGHGRALIARTMASAQARGVRRLFLEVRCSNRAARGLYAACGFVQTGRRPGYYRSVSGEVIDAITLAIAT